MYKKKIKVLTNENVHSTTLEKNEPILGEDVVIEVDDYKTEDVKLKMKDY